MEATPLEAAVFAWIAERNPLLREALAGVVVHGREHTGAGCYVTMGTPDDGSWDRPPVDGPSITSPQLEFGGGSLLWTSSGRPVCLELYAHGDVFPLSLDDFELASAMRVRVVDGDLCDQDVDAIVNAWNRNVIPWWLLLSQGVSRAIKRRAGYGPFRELARHGPIPLGGAVATTAGRLPHRAIVHVAGIDLLWRASERSVRASVRSAIALANERGFRSLAFPLLGAGTGGRRQEDVLRWMQDELGRLSFAGEVRLVRRAPPGSASRAPVS